VQIEDHLCLDVLKKACEDVFLLRSGQVGLERDLIEREIKEGSMTLSNGFIALALLEE
jgi:hypothetical protein